MTCVDKANVLRSYAFFRAVFDEVAADYPDIVAEHGLIDSTTMYLVTRPGHYNVIVTENMFGDILSDLAAATIGGMGPCAFGRGRPVAGAIPGCPWLGP